MMIGVLGPRGKQGEEEEEEKKERPITHPEGVSAGIRTSILPQQEFRSFVPQLSPSPTVPFADHESAKILYQGVDPSALDASETLLRYTFTGPSTVC